jgi:ankyrin repeat protein
MFTDQTFATEQKFEVEAVVAPLAYHWQAVVHKNRSYRIMQKMQGFDIQARGDYNFKTLLNRLRLENDSHTSEMREFLQANKKEGDVLTLKERKFFTEMLKRTWILKHVTDSVQEMQKNGSMLSLEERTRRGMNTANSHTDPAEGHSDNVFFTYGPGEDLETVRFMDGASSIITLDPELLSKNGQQTRQLRPENSPQTQPRQSVPRSLHGTWGSDHFYAYSTEQESIPMILGDCRYSVFYRDIKDTETGVHFVKFCQYDRADGTSATQKFERGEEVFTYPRINQGILLSVIEKVRLMGLKTWELVMNQMSVEEQEKLVQTLYHPGVFEVHKPRSFALNQPGVEIISRESKSEAESTVLPASSQAIIEAAYAGRTKEVLEFCTNNKGFSKISGKLCNNVFTVTLLGAAILGGQAELVKELLNLSVDPRKDTSTIGFLQGTLPCDFGISPLNLVFCLSNPDDDWKITPKKAAAFEILALLIKVGTVDRNNPRIRHPLPVTSEEINMGLELFRAEPEHILYLLNTLGKQLNDTNLSLELAINTGSLPLVQKMLSLGVEVNTWFNENEYFSHLKLSSLEVGVTPLLVAVENGSEPMVHLLLEQDETLINQEFCAIQMRDDTDTVCMTTHDFEGYTPLLMAVEKEHLLLVQLLVERGANVFHRSALGRTALSIATEKGNESILSFLKGVIEPKQDVKETVNLQIVEQTAMESAKIQQHYTRIILTGKESGGQRFFLVSSEREASTFSPFLASIPTRKFCGRFSRESTYKKDIITELNGAMHLALQPDNVQCRSIPALSCYVPEDDTYYVDNVFFFELGDPKKIKEKISSSHYNSLKLVTESDLADLMRNLSGEHRHVQESWLPKITYALLAYINKMLLSTDANMSKEEHEALNIRYQETLREQHQVLQAAKTGNLAQLEALSRQGAVLWHETPTREALADSNQQDLRRVPWQMAWKNNHLDCALYLLKSLPDMGGSRLLRFIDYETIQQIVQTGQLEFYKALHEKKHSFTDFSLNPSSIYSFFGNAIAGGQMPLVCYIGDCISPGSGSAFVAMAEAAKSGNFDEALRLLNGLPESRIQASLTTIFDWNVINNAVSAGHLALYKALHEKKHSFIDFSVNSSLIYPLLGNAIAGGHKPLASYIGDCISPGSGSAFVAMAEAAKAGSFDEALQRLEALPKAFKKLEFLNCSVLNHMPDFNVINVYAYNAFTAAVRLFLISEETQVVQPALESPQLLFMSNVHEEAAKALETKTDVPSVASVVEAPKALEPSNETPKTDVLSAAPVVDASVENTSEAAIATEEAANVNKAETVWYHI